MSNKILVTDSLFIFDEHVKQLEAAGFEIERLDKSNATEAELCKAVKGKVGYILGGVEHVTDKVINAADELKVISFTGADYQHHVDAWQLAGTRGIAITNTPGAPTDAVSELTITLILLMARDIPELSRVGSETFITVPGLQNSQIGIVGMGHIGTRVAELLKALGTKKIVYWNRTRKPEIEKKLGIAYVELDQLFKGSDIITNHVSTNAGQLLNKELIESAKDNVIFINMGGVNNFDHDAIRQKVSESNARIAMDVPEIPDQVRDLPVNKAFYMNTNAGFNTKQFLQLASDIVTQSMINLLTTGKDQYKVN